MQLSIDSVDQNDADVPIPIPTSLKLKLYLGRVLSAWGDRMWQFAIGLYFIKLYPGSFLLAAIHGVISSVLVFVTAPIIGYWIERTSRLKEIRISLFLQNGFVALGAVCVALYEIESIDQNIKQWIAWIGLIAFSIIAQIWSFGFTTCLEKDWILCIATTESQLTDLNAMLRRLDLICNVAAPSVVGALMNLSLLWSAVFMSVWNVCSAVVEYTLLQSVYKSVPNLRVEKKQKLSETFKILNMSAFVMYCKTFLWPGFSFSLLYLTVLGFDSITIGYASEKGINETILGLVSVAASLVGITGTLCYPLLVKKFDVKITALIGFITELICLTICLGDSAKFIIPDERTGVILLLSGITAARFGLWMADMGVNQLIQTETISPPMVGSAQTSVNILMELIKFVIVLCIPSVEHFYILTLISYASVLLGSILFAIFVVRNRHSPESEKFFK
ncbi:unnamed protein product [Oppiella nova]|uniref:Solute carrier family 40 member n=1 Tax=Oppiella nova TaxID=334625 RepID=A0A7R9LCR7_9ACAR|nr:unnamed protein product [Oppiella nova]CAG2162237.1 unnamed protein product [Oppiella nova]